MQGEHIENLSEHDIEDTAKRRKRRVKRMKTAIVVGIILLFLLPTILCIVLGIQVSRLQNQVENLESIHKNEISKLQEDQKGSSMIAFAAERTEIEEKDVNIKGFTGSQQNIEDKMIKSNNKPSGKTQKDQGADPNLQYNEGISEVEIADGGMGADFGVLDKEPKSQHSIKDDINGTGILSDSIQTEASIFDSNDMIGTNSLTEHEDNSNIEVKSKASSPISNDNSTDNKPTDNKAGAAKADKNGIYSGKQVYLTFDDGPSIYTDEILDILAEYSVKATFFVIGMTDKESKRLYQRIIDEGHTLGMHSYSHKYKEIYNSLEDFDKDFTKLWNLLYDTTGYMPIIYRFPGGSSNLVNRHDMNAIIKYLNDKSILYYDWNVDNGDATGEVYTKEKLISNVLDGVALRSRSIVLMHDVQTKKTTVDSLPELLEALISQGAEILPLNEDVKPIQQIKADAVK